MVNHTMHRIHSDNASKRNSRTNSSSVLELHNDTAFYLFFY